MNKKRVALYLGGILVMAVAVSVSLRKYSEAQTRSMASVDESVSYFEQPAAQQKVKEELSVSCDEVEEVVKTVAATSQVVRIKFTECHQFAKKAPLYTVKNLTNGYDAQVFKNQVSVVKGRMPASSSLQLSTDYIQLQNGENIIELEISLNDGQKINKKITISRQ